MLQVSFVIALLYLSGNWPEVVAEYQIFGKKWNVDYTGMIGWVCTLYSFWIVSGLFVTKFFQGQ